MIHPMPESAVARARAFTREVVQPSVDAWEASAVYPRDAVRDSGLTGLFVAPEDGGLGLSFPQAVAVFEELGRGDAALAFSISMHNAVTTAIAGVGDDALRERWVEPLVSGKELGGFYLTEPHAGSDATAITTRATKTGDAWAVSGTKAWVTLGGVASALLVVAKTEEEPGHRDVALFVIDAADPGVHFTEPYRKAASDFLPSRTSSSTTPAPISSSRRARAWAQHSERSTWPVSTSPLSRTASMPRRSTLPSGTRASAPCSGSP